MTIPMHQKARVPGEFDRVAARYDLLTGMNPGYSRHLRKSAERLSLAPGARILDLCCGTGLSTAALVRVYPHATIDAVDASEGMLAVARRKNLGPRVRFSQGDAMDLAASGITGPYDGVLMAYGIRNMPDPDEALRGLFAVLAPGGQVCFHEYSVADSRRSRLVWQAVANTIIVPSGRLLSGSADIYRYLRDSVLAFDGVRAFESRLARAGFSDVHTRPMDGWQHGVVHSFLARRPL
ncbi:MAG: class I SAM-dependent methyltransferase [Deltaproteobacteria bacterium]|nr:class I SAM-dependent methyltransferase [Deltaproteobacteria bacterium]MCB9787481.1 class I SAM-dependent methyltransferase [Deltaproteobacteria bacterium]